MNKTGYTKITRYIHDLERISDGMGALRSLPIDTTEHDATIKASHMITVAILALQEIQPDAVVKTKEVPA